MTTRVLTQRHRAQQLLLRRSTIAQLEKLWPALDWNRLDATYPTLAVRVAALVQRDRQTSAGLAAQYLRALRRTQGIAGEIKPVFAEPLIVDQFGAALHSTTVAPIKNAAARGVAADVAMSNALVLAQGSMARLVLNGGRETVLKTLATDDRAKGWRRIVGSGACDFCREVGGSGSRVYHVDASFDVHDKCGCTSEPVYG